MYSNANAKEQAYPRHEKVVDVGLDNTTTWTARLQHPTPHEGSFRERPKHLQHTFFVLRDSKDMDTQ